MKKFGPLLLFLLLSVRLIGQTAVIVNCDGCIPTFNPIPLETYILNAWVMVENAPQGTIDYGATDFNGPHPLRIEIRSQALNVIAIGIPVGYVIDGWQLIEATFTMPNTNEAPIVLDLVSEDDAAYFDDIRVFPADGSMKCYVYDPHNLRFVAELDERHYATFYEYDNEGRLMRVKKETERGRMTIQETQHNTYHHAP